MPRPVHNRRLHGARRPADNAGAPAERRRSTSGELALADRPIISGPGDDRPRLHVPCVPQPVLAIASTLSVRLFGAPAPNDGSGAYTPGPLRVRAEYRTRHVPGRSAWLSLVSVGPLRAGSAGPNSGLLSALIGRLRPPGPALQGCHRDGRPTRSRRRNSDIGCDRTRVRGPALRGWPSQLSNAWYRAQQSDIPLRVGQRLEALSVGGGRPDPCGPVVVGDTGDSLWGSSPVVVTWSPAVAVGSS